MAPEFLGFWLENERKNEVIVLDFYSADRCHGIHGFLRREGSRNNPFDLEKLLESGPQNSGVLAGDRGED